jgi:hypothetical protein
VSSDSLNPEVLEIIRRQLRLDRSTLEISSDLQEELEDVPAEAPLGLEGACAGYSLKPLPDKFFIAQEFSENKGDFRNAVEGALGKLNVTSVRADDFYWGGPILCKIGALIRGTPFGVYQLSISQNRNVYLELGIAMGLRKPYVLVKDRNAEVPGIIRGIEYYPINSYLETEYQLGELVQQYIAAVITRLTVSRPIISMRDNAVIVPGNLEVVDITYTLAKELANHGYKCLIVSEFDDKLAWFLNRAGISYEFLETYGDVMQGIQGARFGIYRVDTQANASAFVALGMAIGGNRPSLLINNSRDKVPSDLNGLALLSFQGHVDLERRLRLHFSSWLAKYRLQN